MTNFGVNKNNTIFIFGLLVVGEGYSFSLSINQIDDLQLGVIGPKFASLQSHS